jgi:hypothetical protein
MYRQQPRRQRQHLARFTPTAASISASPHPPTSALAMTSLTSRRAVMRFHRERYSFVDPISLPAATGEDRQPPQRNSAEASLVDAGRICAPSASGWAQQVI